MVVEISLLLPSPPFFVLPPSILLFLFSFSSLLTPQGSFLSQKSHIFLKVSPTFSHRSPQIIHHCFITHKIRVLCQIPSADLHILSCSPTHATNSLKKKVSPCYQDSVWKMECIINNALENISSILPFTLQKPSLHCQGGCAAVRGAEPVGDDCSFFYFLLS